MSKLETLAKIEGYDNVLEFLSGFAHDSVSPGICLTPGCDFTTEVEPDQDKGWREDCRMNSVASGMILAGII